MIVKHTVSMADHLIFFDAMITSAVCFAVGHRKIYTNDLRKLDVHCGNCFDVLWVRQVTWIGTSHSVQSFMHGIDGLFLSEYWKFANYVAFLDDSRWSGR